MSEIPLYRGTSLKRAGPPPPLLGPRHITTTESWKEALSYERGTPVKLPGFAWWILCHCVTRLYTFTWNDCRCRANMALGTVQARFWPRLSGKSPLNLLMNSLFARTRTP